MDRLFPPYEDAQWGSPAQINCRGCNKLIDETTAAPVAFLPDRLKVANVLMDMSGPMLVCDQCWAGIVGKYSSEELAEVLKEVSRHCRRMETARRELEKLTNEVRTLQGVLCDIKDRLGPLSRTL